MEATTTRGDHAAPLDRPGPAALVTPAQRSAPASSGAIVHGALGCPSLDELAQQDICAALLSTPGLDARHIEVEMTGAGVLLRGQVACAMDRERALRIAKRLAAPRPVRETLTVLPGTDVDTAPHPSQGAAAAADAG